MIVHIDKSFERDLKKIGLKKLNERVKEIIILLKELNSIDEIPNQKKLTGHKTYYRIRIGDYRIGCEIAVRNEIELVRILHRKDIYKYFP